MGQFVSYCVGKSEDSGRVYLFFEYVIVGVDDYGCVFHGTPVEFWAENLVIFCERVVVSKELFIEFHAFYSYFKYVI